MGNCAWKTVRGKSCVEKTSLGHTFLRLSVIVRGKKLHSGIRFCVWLESCEGENRAWEKSYVGKIVRGKNRALPSNLSACKSGEEVLLGVFSRIRIIVGKVVVSEKKNI